MTTLRIDLTKDPEVAQLVADMQPGDPVTLHTTIKALTPGQDVILTVESAAEGEDSDDEDDGSDGSDANGSSGDAASGTDSGASSDSSGDTSAGLQGAPGS